MEEKFDQILHNQTKMLEHMTVLTRDVKDLKEGQNELKERVETIEEGQEELKQGQKELKRKVALLETGQREIKYEQKEIRCELKWLHRDYLVTRDRVEDLEEAHLQNV